MKRRTQNRIRTITSGFGCGPLSVDTAARTWSHQGVKCLCGETVFRVHAKGLTCRRNSCGRQYPYTCQARS